MTGELDLPGLAHRAAPLWPRLDGAAAAGDSGDAGAATRLIERWAQVVARGDMNRLHERLAWENWDLELAGKALAAPVVPIGDDWTPRLAALRQAAMEFHQRRPTRLCADPAHPRPFEDLLLPFVAGARRQLAIAIGQDGDLDTLPTGPLTPAAYLALELGLLDRLSRIASPCLLEEFAAWRPAGIGLLNGLIGAAAKAGRQRYEAFVSAHLADGWARILDQYPVLAALMVRVVDRWVAFCAEFLSHLLTDLPMLAGRFGQPGEPLGDVTHVRFGLSDTHRQGRCVIAVRFAAGVQLAYKPKALAIDMAFARLVDWCNAQGLPLDLRVPQVLDRGEYGWVEWIEGRPCADQAEATAFYRRAGMLLALLHVLRATDCHYENLVAHGGYLVPVDVETLLSPEIEPPGPPQAMPNARFWDSVIRVNLLPHWELWPESRMPFDISGLGGIDSQPTPCPVQQWRNINTDDMDVFQDVAMLARQANGPVLDGRPLSPAAHAEELLGGFSAMYRMLLARREELVVPGGVLDGFGGVRVRYVFRHTQQYGQILRHSLIPAYLTDGRRRSIELDALSRGFVDEPRARTAWPIARAERQALEQLDIPRFETLADDTSLLLDDQVVLREFCQRSSLQRVRDRLAELDPSDLDLQLRIIAASLDAWRAGGGVPGIEPASPPTCTGPVPGGCRLSMTDFAGQARAIADELAAAAFRNEDGSVGWLGYAPLGNSGRCQLRAVGEDYYGGRVGIAVFLAACDHWSGDDRHADLVRQALQPLRGTIGSLDEPDLRRFVRESGIGGAAGVGGHLYALALIADWRQEEGLLADSLKLALALGDDIIREDMAFDVMAGAAGALFGLHKLSALVPDDGLCERMAACTSRLLKGQQALGEFRGAWWTIEGSQPLTGFSHGASGIACALARAGVPAGDPRLASALAEAMAYERTAFVPSHGNWRDFRQQTTAQDSPVCACAWCHGAPGIAVARLAMASRSDRGIADDLDIALATSAIADGSAADHMCCGSFGRIDVLVHAATELQRGDLLALARRQAADVLARAEPLRVFPDGRSRVRRPGLFDGLAGIGYVLLRLADPGRLPCLLAWR
jgi:type 2 lantibiotic biosynthesis protein LanM